MTLRRRWVLVLGVVLVTATGRGQAQEGGVQEQDRRLTDIRDTNKVYKFVGYSSKEEWLTQARHLRQQVLVSAGLWPMPPKAPLNAVIFDRIQHQAYSIEKVYFESHPGFFVTGNLYRPAGRSGPHPAVLCPHGHWSYGRLENSELCSVPGRAINFALQGYVAFSYDMIGFNDSTQLSHSFGGQFEELWGVSLSGLQLWNSIRAVDFLCSLPDVDKDRIGCTGASGGATQTFLLMAVDDRIKVGAPVNMVSARMQGGCLCENAPGLRIDTFNVEIAALAAPRPLLLVSATGDWTRDTPEIEYPAIRSIYRLFGAEDKVRAVQMNAPHNYNKDSREAVYAWFGRWLLGITDESRLKERSFRVESPPRLLVFYGRALPNNAVDAQQLTSYLVQSAEKQIASLKPRDKDGLGKFREQMEPALAHSLAARLPDPRELEVRSLERAVQRGLTVERFYLGRKQTGDRVPVTLWLPVRPDSKRTATLVVDQGGRAALTRDDWMSAGNLIAGLLRKGHTVMSVDCFKTGHLKGEGEHPKNVRFFTTYNRTDDANRVQDILTAVAYLSSRSDIARINLIGTGNAGLWCLLARGLAPQVRRAVIDAAHFDNGSDNAFLNGLFAPGLRRAGDLRTAATLAAPLPLMIHNTGGHFRTTWIQDVYQSTGAGAELRVVDERLGVTQMLEWLQ